MKEAEIQKRIAEIHHALKVLPLRGISKTKGEEEGVYKSHFSDDRTTMGESLDYLRLQIKYLLFDLEATKRENRYLRQMLETHRRPGRDDTGIS